MKIRNGFVSNSSSSSFIVSTDIELSSISQEEFNEILGDFQVEYKWDKYCSIQEYSNRIFNDLKEGKASDEDIKEELKELVGLEAYNQVDALPMSTKEESDYKWEQYDKLVNEYTEKHLPKIKSKGKFHYVVEYSDECGDSALEHGDIFRNFNYVRISKH